MNTSTARWKRSKNGILAGVCAGLAKELGFEAWVVRALFFALVLFAGFGLWIYIALAVSLPVEHKMDRASEGMVLGVCKRLSEKTEIELGVVRAITCLLIIHSLGAGLVFYVILFFLVPENSTSRSRTLSSQD